MANKAVKLKNIIQLLYLGLGIKIKQNKKKKVSKMASLLDSTHFYIASFDQSNIVVVKKPVISNSQVQINLKLLKSNGVKRIRSIPIIGAATSLFDYELPSCSDNLHICEYDYGGEKPLVFGYHSHYFIFEPQDNVLGRYLMLRLEHKYNNTHRLAKQSPKNVLDKFKEFLSTQYINKSTASEIIAALTPFIGTFKRRKDFDINMCLGIIFSGAPGDGKTYLATKIIETVAHLLKINAVAEEGNTFNKAAKLAADFVAIIDDMNIAHFKRGHIYGEICQNILSEMDRPGCNRLFLMTTNEVVNKETVDPAFFRPGRVQNIIIFKRPDNDVKNKIISDMENSLINAGVEIDKDFIAGIKMFAEEDEYSLAEMMRLKNLIITDIIMENNLKHPKWYANNCKAVKVKEQEYEQSTI